MNLRLSNKTIAFVLTSAALLAFSACDEKAPSPESGDPVGSEAHAGGHPPDADSKDHAMAKKVSIEVNATGYKPDMVMAKAGESVTIVFTRVTDKGCGQKILIPSEGIEKDLPLNTPVEITFTPKESGNLGFSCGMKMMKGTIMVH